MASMEVIKNREVRGCILRALAHTPCRAISTKSLTRALIGTYPDVVSDIRAHLAYLADKGYITLADVDVGTESGIDLLVNLTAKGVDLIEESIPADPGITL